MKDGRLVVGEPVRRGRGAADSPALAGDRLHASVWDAAAPKWAAHQFHAAVFAASKMVNSMLQAKVDRKDFGEVQLVQEAFSKNPPAVGRPRLRFPTIGDDKTRESMTQGALSFGVGCFQAIRNPVGHLTDDQHELSEQDALERLAALSLFAKWIDQATLTSDGD